MNQKEMSEFAARVRQHLFGHILPFWCGQALDEQHGGWLAWLANDLKPDHRQPKGLILNTRILWTFSAVHGVQQDSLYQEMAKRALDWVINRFWDTQHGGAFWHLDDTGRVRDDSKKTYGQAFYIYALAEYHLAFAHSSALARACEMFELLDRHAHDPKDGGYFEAYHRDWTVAGPEWGVGGTGLSAKKSMNTSLHLLEAFTNLYRAWKDPRLAERLRELIRAFEKHILDTRTQHFHHFFDQNWKVLSDNYTFGHDIEGSWLLCEAAEVVADAALLRRIKKRALSMAKTALKEGLAADGGLHHEGRGGKIVDRGREWWPQAEAVVGFVNAYQINGEQKYLEAARSVWDFIERKIVDRKHGDWFWRIDEHGKPDAKRPKVSEWKGPYHSGRACLEAMRRLDQITQK